MALPGLHTDHELLRLLPAGDESAFTELFRRYQGAVRAAAFHLLKSKELTEDITQEIFLQLWKDRARAADIEDLSAYLFIATRNNALKKFRKAKLRQDYQSYLIQTISALDTLSTGQLADYNDLRKSIEEAVATLPPQQQTAFRLSREKGLSHAEVAEQMNISYRTASDYILKALNHIRHFLHQRAALTLLFFPGLL